MLQTIRRTNITNITHIIQQPQISTFNLPSHTLNHVHITALQTTFLQQTQQNSQTKKHSESTNFKHPNPKGINMSNQQSTIKRELTAVVDLGRLFSSHCN
ncbi:hypothetical protein PoB_003946100 [Plakobranchus ocellatus]|uniref:Uncharacterized protein n=1 Tax=Plakobranchus ocellatus TaxID=259542 RepID=A0AAV4AP69_9GAST|nr:hypothetical protein PoB_003946100 [Plakobranchus ocellatus]